MNEPRMRVGQEGSTVREGDPVPGSEFGETYESGQFAPSIDELATLTISAAKKAGLISRNLPLFDENGDVDKKKLEAWEPANEFRNHGIHASVTIPKHSLAVILSVADKFPGMLDKLNITNITQGESGAGLGEPIITAFVSSQQRIFRSSLMVYPAFYKYITVPLVPEIPGIKTGISVATYATVHSIGHVLYQKMIFNSELHLLGAFMETSGWTKRTDPGLKKGSYLGKPNMQVWMKDSTKRSISEIAKFSPAEDFADTFAQYWFHREYLRRAFPDKLKAMEDIIEKNKLTEGH